MPTKQREEQQLIHPNNQNLQRLIHINTMEASKAIIAEKEMEKKHFILVHGLGHGAWCWYKLSTILQSTGHRVTTVDLAASGVDLRSFDEISTFNEYSKPLIDVVASLPEGEKGVLVGHSFGGVSIALAADLFPEKVEAVVFVAAFLPDSVHPPSYVIEEHFKRNPGGGFTDSSFNFNNSLDKPFTTLLFGRKDLASLLYQHTPQEDYTLALTLVRVGSLFLEELSKLPPFSKERYGSVKKIFVVCKDDNCIGEDSQRWMIDNYTVDGVMEIEGADHMAMLSKPKELTNCLLEIAGE